MAVMLFAVVLKLAGCVLVDQKLLRMYALFVVQVGIRITQLIQKFVFLFEEMDLKLAQRNAMMQIQLMETAVKVTALQ